MKRVRKAVLMMGAALIVGANAMAQDQNALEEQARVARAAAAGMALATADTAFDLRVDAQPMLAQIDALTRNLRSQIEPLAAVAGFGRFEAMAPRIAQLDMLAQNRAASGFAYQYRLGRDNDNDYRRGSNSLDRRDWENAVQSFQKVIDEKGPRAEGAMYWKAYALNKLGRRQDASATLAELQKTFPASRWGNDAKALEAEVKQAGGEGPSPEAESDEEMKVLAINSLMNNDPERAVPLLEKLLKGASSPKLKERALFVLAQSKSERGREVLAQFARGSGNPDLQLKAVEYLGVYGGKDNAQILNEIYGSSQDVSVKRVILRSFMISQDKGRLWNAAKSEQNPILRGEAIHLLGALKAQSELGQLYQSEQAPEVKAAILEALFISGDKERLIQIAKTEKDPKLRSRAIHLLGTLHDAVTGEALVSIYNSDPGSAEVKKQILNSLFVSNNARALVDVARKESNPELRRDAVQRLSMMKSKEATDYLMELLNK